MTEGTPPNLAAAPRRALELLKGVRGVGPIGLAWDAGRRVVRVDAAPSADHALLSRKLSDLGADFVIRSVTGKISAD